MPLSEQAALEIQDLTWALADDALTPEEAKRLEALLLEDADARKLYVQCMQLQADLHLYFNPQKAQWPITSTATPVLKNLPTGNGGTSSRCGSEL